MKSWLYDRNVINLWKLREVCTFYFVGRVYFCHNVFFSECFFFRMYSPLAKEVKNRFVIDCLLASRW